MTRSHLLSLCGSLPRFVRIGGLIGGIVASAASAQDYRSALIYNPYSISFGAVLVGRTSDKQTITLLNTGNPTVQIDKITVTGDFAQTSNCPTPPASLAQNQTCGVDVTFKPIGPGSASGTVSVFHDRRPSPLTVSLIGSGTLNASAVQISLSSLNFGEQNVGTSSMPRTITVSNPGEKSVLVSAISVDGDFKMMSGSTCRGGQESLAPSSSCTVVVTFNPLGLGTREGRLTFTDDAPGSPRTVVLTGIGKQ